MKLDDFDIKLEMGTAIINILWLRTQHFASDTYVRAHCHSGYEIHIIPSGYGILKLHNNQFEIKPESFYITGPDIYHEQIADKKNPMKEYCINFEIRRNEEVEIDKHSDNNEISNILRTVDLYINRDEYIIHKLFENIMNETLNKQLGYFEIVKHNLMQIFINLARSISNNPQSDYIMLKKSIDDKRRILIDEYFNITRREISVHELAGIVGMSVRQLNRILIDYYGMSFKKKMIKTKMNKAMALLKSTNLMVKDVSNAVGIEDAAYFSRVFKNYWGMCPTDSARGNK